MKELDPNSRSVKRRMGTPNNAAEISEAADILEVQTKALYDLLYELGVLSKNGRKHTIATLKWEKLGYFKNRFRRLKFNAPHKLVEYTVVTEGGMTFLRDLLEKHDIERAPKRTPKEHQLTAKNMTVDGQIARKECMDIADECTDSRSCG